MTTSTTPIDHSPLATYFSASETALQLGVCQKTLSRWRALRAGPPITRLGRKVLYRREAVVDWLRAQERPA